MSRDCSAQAGCTAHGNCCCTSARAASYTACTQTRPGQARHETGRRRCSQRSASCKQSTGSSSVQHAGSRVEGETSSSAYSQCAACRYWPQLLSLPAMLCDCLCLSSLGLLLTHGSPETGLVVLRSQHPCPVPWELPCTSPRPFAKQELG